MSNIDEIERDIDPPLEDPRVMKIKSYWVTYMWDDGSTGELSWKDKNIEAELDEIEYEYNRDIIEDQAQKYGDPDGDY